MLSRVLSNYTLNYLEELAVKVGLVKKPQKTLLWTKKHKWDPMFPIPHSASAAQPSYAYPSPSFELTDLSDTAPRTASFAQETPLMAHSLFPPAITSRPRNESDASINPLSPYPPLRRSEDSAQPLIQRPSGAYRQRSDSERADARVSFEEPVFPASPPDERGWGAPAVSVQSRQGYQRADSDPRLPPVEMGRGGRSQGLGIHVTDRDLERGGV